MIESAVWGVIGFGILVFVVLVFGIIALGKYVFSTKKEDDKRTE